MGINDLPHSCSGFLFKNGERTNLNSSCKHTERGIFALLPMNMWCRWISKDLVRLYDHMAFFLMYIWGTEKTLAPAMYSRASVLAADYLIAVSEGKLSVVCKTDWTALSICCTEDKRTFLLKVMSVVHVAWDSVYFLCVLHLWCASYSLWNLHLECALSHIISRQYFDFFSCNI